MKLLGSYFKQDAIESFVLLVPVVFAENKAKIILSGIPSIFRSYSGTRIFSRTARVDEINQNKTE